MRSNEWRFLMENIWFILKAKYFNHKNLIITLWRVLRCPNFSLNFEKDRKNSWIETKNRLKILITFDALLCDFPTKDFCLRWEKFTVKNIKAALLDNVEMVLATFKNSLKRKLTGSLPKPYDSIINLLVILK